MATRRVNDPNAKQSRRPPARTPEERENQLIAHAVDLAERQILDGSASAQVITHFLKLGSTSEKLQQQYKAEEINLLRIKGEMYASQQKHEERLSDALKAFKEYAGNGPLTEGDDR